MAGFNRIPEDERWIIEAWGEFSYIAGPGLIFVMPLRDRIRDKHLVEKEQEIPLFAEPIKIDFTNGSATPQGVTAFVKIIERDSGPYKATYRVENWKKAVIAPLESKVRACLTKLTIEKGLKSRRNLLVLFDKSSRQELETELSEWGLVATKITLRDLALDPSLSKARDQFFSKEQERRMADLESTIRAQKDMGAYIASMAESQGVDREVIQAKIAASSKLSKESRQIALDLVQRRMALDGNSFMERLIRTPDGTTAEGLITLLGELIFSGGPRGSSPQPPGETEGSEVRIKSPTGKTLVRDKKGNRRIE